MHAAGQLIRYTIADGVAQLTLDHPPLNILTTPMITELAQLLEALAGEPGLKVAVLAGSEKAFCAGVDVRDHSPDRAPSMIKSFGELFTRLRTLPMPTVAVVLGPALGGGTELALGCDLVLAGTSARFGLPEIKLGVFPPIAAALLPRLIGQQRAARLLLTGETLLAEEAANLGLVTHLVADHEVPATLAGLLKQFQDMSAAALHITKRAMIYGADLELAEALPRIEDLYLHELMLTADAQEGIEAFLEKRQPVWQDR
ncbi:MAG: enoyl-CoA hydratase/isomerase family protein [Ktedonobacterales bacterium]